MDILSKLSIRAKILSLVGILLIMMAGIAGYGYFKLKQIGHELHGVITEDIPLTGLTSGITSSQFEGALLLERAIQVAGLKDDKLSNIHDFRVQIEHLNKSIDQQITEAKSILDQMLTHALSEELRQKEETLRRFLVSIEDEHLEYETLTNDFLVHIESDQIQSAQKMLSTLHDKQQVLLDHLESFLIGIEKLTEHALLLVEEHEVDAINGMGLIGLVSLILGGVLSYLYVLAMTGPLKKAVNASNQMAEGDFTVSLANSGRDEIASLLNCMHNMARKLEDTIYHVLNSSAEISSAATEMAATAEQTKERVTEQHLNTDQVTTAMHEMATTIQQIADHTGTTALETESTKQQVSKGLQAVSDNLKNIKDLVNQVQQASNEVAAAREQSNAIVDFVGHINEIAEQTNLLALNAAIEAARAGEQGRGFSVVADEVRKLSGKTQSATSEIQQFVEQLKEKTSSATSTIEQTSTMVESSAMQASQCETILETINHSIDELNLKNIEIATICEQQSAAAEEINRSMVSISQSSTEVQSGSELNARASEELSQLAIELQRVMGQFKVREAT
ncbi:methyl-accepting chemotaxis protein [Vibrio hannami]|uniref:methyl-accepting chemotaxis protein n=1 Tax=Vibrio hannami TaxID=2717094 RepID=UPI00240F49AF|nr:methyl-accepting chemotaxis protein [Vibrio hannami]MDG3086188.1 methyl-accepting chemotaxis protein [Vibrio hannami]